MIAQAAITIWRVSDLAKRLEKAELEIDGLREFRAQIRERLRPHKPEDDE